MFNIITNHVEQAIARLISRYKGKVTIEATVAGIVTPLQDLEYVFNDLNTLRTLEGSMGYQLDLLGGIVGLARVPGQDDTTYRRLIKAQIAINVSQGRIADVINAFQLLTAATTVLVDELYPAAVIAESEVVFATQADVNELIAIMDRVVSGGVRFEGVVTFDPTTPFAFDGNLFGAGFGDTGDPTAGGLFASINTYMPDFAMDGDDPDTAGFGDLNDSLIGGVFVSV